MLTASVPALAHAPLPAQTGTADQSAPAKAAGAPESPDIVVIASPSDRSSIDRTTYIVRDNAESRAANVLSLLAHVPSVEVTQEGDLRLFGRNGVKVLIDGREVANPLLALRNLQGSQIVKIEVISNPSAQFSSRGTAGIINVVTRRSVGPGFGGSLTAAGGTFGSYDIKLSPTWTAGPLSVSASLGASRSASRGEISRERISVDSASPVAIEESEIGSFHARDHSVKGSLMGSYRLSSRDTISSTVLVIRSATRRNGLTSLRSSTGTGEPIEQASGQRVDFRSSDYSLEYRRERGRKGEALTVSAQRSTSTFSVDELSALTGPLAAPQGSFLMKDRSSSRLSTLKADYVRPDGNHRLLRAGASIERRSETSSSVSTGDLPFSDSPANVSSLIHGTWTDRTAYLAYQFSVRSLTFLPGLRIESRRYDRGADGARVGQGGTHLFPTLHIERALGDSTHIDLSYSRRIAWPNLSSFDASLRFRDTTTAVVGNPSLRPELTNSYEAKLSTKAGKHDLDVTGYIRTTHNLFSSLSQLSDENVLVSRSINLGELTLRGINIALRGPLGKQFHYSTSADMAGESIVGSTVDRSLLRSRPRYSFFAELEYRDGIADRPGSDHATLSYRYNGPYERGLVIASAYSTISATWSRTLTDRLATVVDLAGIRIPRTGRTTSYSPLIVSSDIYRGLGVKLTASLTYSFRAAGGS